MEVKIRKFEYKDINNKIQWINNPLNNAYLHYDLPLEYEKTVNWYNNNRDNNTRLDCVIEADGKPVGLIGLLSIDNNRKDAEYYISMGEVEYKGKGISYKASNLLLIYAFNKLSLENVYLYTEVDNVPAQRLFKKLGFTLIEKKEKDIKINDKYIDRYFYSISKFSYFLKNNHSPIYNVGIVNDNRLFIKREDLIPYSFGGNKARKAAKFFEIIDAMKKDYIITYGSSHSNHCRIIANLAAYRNIPCLIISPEEKQTKTSNKILMKLFGADIITVPVDEVSKTIDRELKKIEEKGFNPYFIPGGGHSNLGTEAYIDCYNEIKKYEEKNDTEFDYIFLASGTGTTQAGLVCGQILNNDHKKIVGISIARVNPRGRNIVLKSVKEYLPDIDESLISQNTIFLDEYIISGYSSKNREIEDTVREMIRNYGIPLDCTYTGKAYLGMNKYLNDNNIRNKNILFIHTGGTPLFFDDLNSIGDYE